MKFKRLPIPGFVLFIIVLAAMFFALALKQAHAAAPADCSQTPYNRCLNVGYFTGEQRMAQSGVPGNQFPWPNWYCYTDANAQNNCWAVPSNVDNNMPSTTAAANFIAYTNAALFGNNYVGPPYCTVWSTDGAGNPNYDNNNTCDAARRLVTGAAFMVDTMLGRWGTDYGSGDNGITNGIAYARAHFTDWSNLVIAYANAGLVDWNRIEVQQPHLNTTSVGYGYSARDINYFNFLTTEVSSMIWFRSPNGTIYKINRICLNVSGTANLAPPVTVQGHIFSSQDTGKNYSGIIIDTCIAGLSPVTDGAGNYSFMIPAGTNYCLRINAASNPPPGTSKPPYVRPWGEGFAGYPGCGAYGPPAQPAPSPVGHCSGATYEWQVAGGNYNNGLDRTSDIGFDFVFDPLSLACGNVTTNPSAPEVGVPFSVSVSFNLSNPTPSTFAYTTTLSLPGATIPSPNPINGTFAANTASSGQITFGGITAPAGRYAGSFVIGGGSVSLSCPFGDGVPGTPPTNPNPPPSIPVTAKPYMRVYGGDVLSGYGFGASCDTRTSGIVGYNSEAPNYGGGGVQFAAKATGTITDFVSASLRLGGANGPPGGLSFANTTVSPPSMGGNFGVPTCAEDFYGDSAASTVATDPGGNIGTTTVPLSAHIVYRHVGDVTITGTGVTFTGAGGSWTVANIPSLYLIVKGNIYIDKGVTNLDGVYIAQDDGTGTKGTIYTCSSGAASVAKDANYYANCNTKLIVNGAFVANRVVFGRTKGTLAAATTNEPSISANIAETINYSPELWIICPKVISCSGVNGSSGGTIKYDSITSLPPIL